MRVATALLGTRARSRDAERCKHMAAALPSASLSTEEHPWTRKGVGYRIARWRCAHLPLLMCRRMRFTLGACSKRWYPHVVLEPDRKDNSMLVSSHWRPVSWRAPTRSWSAHTHPPCPTLCPNKGWVQPITSPTTSPFAAYRRNCLVDSCLHAGKPVIRPPPKGFHPHLLSVRRWPSGRVTVNNNPCTKVPRQDSVLLA
jgi:hypothetical protein